MLFAYRNTPHEATRKKPSYLLYGRDCHYPIEATFLPANEVEGADLTGYRQELTDANKRSYYSVSPESPEALQKVYDMFSYAVQDWRSSANSIPSGRVRKVLEVISSMAWTLEVSLHFKDDNT